MAKITSPVKPEEIVKVSKAKSRNVINQANRSKRYWHKRIDAEMQSIYDNTMKRNVKLQIVYQKAYENMEREMAAFIKKYGTDGVLTRSEYYAFNRNLEVVKSMRRELVKVGEAELKFINRSLMESYRKAYVLMGRDMNLMLNARIKITGPPVELMSRAMSMNLQGKHFSSRIWNNKEKALNRIQDTIEQAVSQNLSYDKAAKLLSERMNVAYSDADRLIATEMNHLITEAQADSFESFGIRQYEIIAVMDDRTTEICRTMDGKIYNLDDRKPGFNAPPFHVRCRTTIAPAVYWEDIAPRD